MKVLDIILIMFFPPISVATKYGLGKTFWINVILSAIGWVPGVLHAYVMAKKEENRVHEIA